jgi:hypothetical protein
MVLEFSREWAWIVFNSNRQCRDLSKSAERSNYYSSTFSYHAPEGRFRDWSRYGWNRCSWAKFEKPQVAWRDVKENGSSDSSHLSTSEQEL